MPDFIESEAKIGGGYGGGGGYSSSFGGRDVRTGASGDVRDKGALCAARSGARDFFTSLCLGSCGGDT